MSDKSILTNDQMDKLLDDGGKCDECGRRVLGTPVRNWNGNGKNWCKPCAQKIAEKTVSAGNR